MRCEERGCTVTAKRVFRGRFYCRPHYKAVLRHVTDQIRKDALVKWGEALVAVNVVCVFFERLWCHCTCGHAFRQHPPSPLYSCAAPGCDCKVYLRDWTRSEVSRA